MGIPLVGDPAQLFRVRVVADSISPAGDRLTTFRLVYPRVLLAELNTHRILSKSSESSRAVPVHRRLAAVKANPFRPLRWGAKTAGMGAGDDLTAGQQEIAAKLWNEAVEEACEFAFRLAGLNAAKEEVNRLTEPFSLAKTVVTGTDWANFFALRTHKDAYPPFRFLARAMWVALNRSTPTPRRTDWHLPFITDDDRDAVRKYAADHPADRDRPDWLITYEGQYLSSWDEFHLCRWSAARCARVSYGRVDGTPTTPAEDDATWAKLIGMADSPLQAAWGVGGTSADPVHASPLEHQGTPATTFVASGKKYTRNFTGWVQFRSLVRNDTAQAFDPTPAVEADWSAAIPDAVLNDVTDPT